MPPACEPPRLRGLTRLTALLPLLATPHSLLGAAANPAPRPNFVLILVDDLRWDDLGCTGQPFVQTPHIDRLAREGIRFRNAFVTTPLCSPSRASFLTGQYAHTHGIIDNTDRSAASHKLTTFPRLLQQAGYETAFIGKWHMGNDPSPRPGFDYWVGFKGQGTYIDPELNVNGRTVPTRGYITDLLQDHVLRFLRAPREKPFLLYLAHKALHPELIQNADGRLSDPHAENFIPAERHRSLYAGAAIPRRPNAGRPPEGKPALQRPIPGLPPLGPATGTRDEVVRGRLRCLMAIEEGVGQILQTLEQSGEIDRTLIAFTGDNGYFYGEHSLSVERRLAYEESIRIPLLMRYPALVRPGTVRDEMVLNIDLAPTFLDLAGAPIPPAIQGRSLVPLLQGEHPLWRDAFLIELASDRVFPRMLNMGYQAVRTERWKYIQYLDLEGMDELYDLRDDPYELTNLFGRETVAPILADLKRVRDRLKR